MSFYLENRYSDVSEEILLNQVKAIHMEQPNSGAEEVRASLHASRKHGCAKGKRVRRALAIADQSYWNCKPVGSDISEEEI